MSDRNEKGRGNIRGQRSTLAGIEEAEQAVLLTEDGRNVAAVMLGRRGGLKGGRARADRLPPEERRRIAKIAAAARWSKKEPS